MSDRQNPHKSPFLRFVGVRETARKPKVLAPQCDSPPPSGRCALLRSPTQRRHPAVPMSTSVDCRGTGGLGLEKHGRQGRLPVSLSPRLAALGRAAAQKHSRRSTASLFCGRRRRGARARGSAPFRTRHDSPRKAAGYRTRPKSVRRSSRLGARGKDRMQER